MRKFILIGLMACLVGTLGMVMFKRASPENSRLGSRESTLAQPLQLKEADPSPEPPDSPLDGKAENKGSSDRLSAVTRDLAARLHLLSVNPQMRELVARRMAQDYAELFRALRLSTEKEELLAQIIVDRFFSVIGPERDSYDKLAQDLLTPDEYEKYATYRDELPIKAMVKEVSGTLQIESAGIASEEVGRAIRSSSNRSSPYWREVEQRFAAGELNDAELAQAEQNALSQFDQAVVREVRSLSSAQRAAFREWFRNSVTATVASIRQGKGGK